MKIANWGLASVHLGWVVECLSLKRTAIQEWLQRKLPGIVRAVMILNKECKYSDKYVRVMLPPRMRMQTGPDELQCVLMHQLLLSII